MTHWDAHAGQRVDFVTYSFDGRSVRLINSAIAHPDSLYTANDERILKITPIGDDTMAIDTPSTRYLVSYLAYAVFCGNQPVSTLSEPIDVTPPPEPQPRQWERSRSSAWIWLWLFRLGLALVIVSAVCGGWIVSRTRGILRGIVATGLLTIMGLLLLLVMVMIIEWWRAKQMLKRRCPHCGMQDWEVMDYPEHRCRTCGTLCDLRDGRYRTQAMQNREVLAAWKAIFVTPNRVWKDIEWPGDLTRREEEADRA